MNPNLGSADRGVRYLLATALVIAGLLTGPGGIPSILMYAAAGVLALTATVSFCPIYRIFGIRTCPAPNASR